MPSEDTALRDTSCRTGSSAEHLQSDFGGRSLQLKACLQKIVLGFALQFYSAPRSSCCRGEMVDLSGFGCVFPVKMVISVIVNWKIWSD